VYRLLLSINDEVIKKYVPIGVYHVISHGRASSPTGRLKLIASHAWWDAAQPWYQLDTLSAVPLHCTYWQLAGAELRAPTLSETNLNPYLYNDMVEDMDEIAHCCNKTSTSTQYTQHHVKRANETNKVIVSGVIRLAESALYNAFSRSKLSAWSVQAHLHTFKTNTPTQKMEYAKRKHQNCRGSTRLCSLYRPGSSSNSHVIVLQLLWIAVGLLCGGCLDKNHGMVESVSIDLSVSDSTTPHHGSEWEEDLEYHDELPWVSWQSSSQIPFRDSHSLQRPTTNTNSRNDWGTCQSSSSIILLEVSDAHPENAATDQSLDHNENDPKSVTRTFELLEPLHLELGVGGKVRHVIDYAYSPVVGFGSRSQREQGASGSVEDQTALIPTRIADDDTATCANTAPPTTPTTTSRRHMVRYPTTRATVATVTIERPNTSTRLSWLLRGGNPWFWWQWWIPWTMWQQHQRQGNVHCSTKYQLYHEAFAGGSHGQVWKGRLRRRRRPLDKQDNHKNRKHKHQPINEPLLIFKRLRVDRGFRTLEAGLREVYFGQRLLTMHQDKSERETSATPAALPKLLFTEYVEHFFGESNGELWIVFRDAGPSLRAILYAGTDTGDYVVYQHSWLWTLMRMSLKEAAAQGRRTRHKAESAADTVDEHPLRAASTAPDEIPSGNDNHEYQPPVVDAVFGSALIKDILQQVRHVCARL
jgi:hypothetical protein